MRRETNPPVIGANSFPYANMAVTLKSASETIHRILVLVNQHMISNHRPVIISRTQAYE